MTNVRRVDYIGDGLSEAQLAPTPWQQARRWVDEAVARSQAASDVPENPSENTELKVLVTVSARTPDYSAYEMTAPLTLRATAGTWSVAAVDPVPLIDTTATPTPVPSQQPLR